jgi:predicted transposase/invertase (TIGR01784 family)
MSETNEIKNPHDKTFKEIMSDTSIAKDFIKNYLPPEILKQIDLNKLEIKKDTFIEPELKERYTDILYQVKLNNKKAYLYLLFEHKSYKDKNITIQLLQYMVNIWQLDIKQKAKELPIIIPIVIYHGIGKWNIGLKLSDILTPPAPLELKKYIPDYQYILYDLPTYNSEQIIGEAKLQIFIRTLANTFNPEFTIKTVNTILEMLRELEKEDTANITFIKIIIKYIMAVIDDLTIEELNKRYQLISREGSDLIMTIAEQLREEGRAIGEAIGEAKGEAKKQIEIAQNMIKLKMDITTIQQVTGLSQKEIKQLMQ